MIQSTRSAARWLGSLALACLVAGCGGPPSGSPDNGATVPSQNRDAAPAVTIARLAKEDVDPSEARRELTALMNRSPALSRTDTNAALLARASACERLEQWPDALADYNAVLAPASQPGSTQHEQALRGRAYIARIQERWEAALGDYDTILASADLAADERAQILARRGIIFQIIGEADKAAADFTAAAAVPNLTLETRVDVGRLRGQACVIADDLDGALKAYAETLALGGLTDPRKYALLQERAQVYAHHDREEDAIADFTTALALPNNTPAMKAWALYNRGLVHLDTGHTLGAETPGPADFALMDFAAVLAMPDAPQSVKIQTRMQRALVYAETGNDPLAEADIAAVVGDPQADDDDKARVLGVRAALASGAGQFAAAVKAYSDALALKHLSSELKYSTLVRRALAHIKNGEEAAGRDDCTAVIDGLNADDDEMSQALLTRAQTFNISGNEWVKAEADLQRILRLNQPPAENKRSALHYLATLYELQSLPDKALPLYKALIDGEDTPPDERIQAHFERGELYHRIGKSELALADFAAILADPNAEPEHKSHAHRARIQVFMALQLAEPALKETDAALADAAAHDPSRVTLHKLRGTLLEALGRARESVADWQALMAAAHTPAADLVATDHFALGLALADADKLDDAIQAYQAGLAMDQAKFLPEEELTRLTALKTQDPTRTATVDAVLKAFPPAAMPAPEAPPPPPTPTPTPTPAPAPTPQTPPAPPAPAVP